MGRAGNFAHPVSDGVSCFWVFFLLLVVLRGGRSVRRVYGDADEGCIRERTFADFAASSGDGENAYLQVMLRWARGRGQIESRRLGPVLSADLEAGRKGVELKLRASLDLAQRHAHVRDATRQDRRE